VAVHVGLPVAVHLGLPAVGMPVAVGRRRSFSRHFVGHFSSSTPRSRRRGEEGRFAVASLTFVNASRIHSTLQGPRGLHPLDLQVGDGEFVALVGPSGCGKSTTLRLAAGLHDPGSADAGQVLVGDVDVSLLPPNRRGVSMVFQSYALYPHKTGRGNIEFPLRTAKTDPAVIAERVRTYAGMLQLENVLERKPRQMSGGERQRVAVARALAPQPQVLMMDEPLGALDAQLRELVRTSLKERLTRLGMTTLYVTHDQVEASSMADRVVVLKDGVAIQVGTPDELHEDPCDVFVAGFIGEPTANLFTTDLTDGALRIGDWTHPLPRQHAQGRTRLTVGIRPCHLKAAPSGIRAQVTSTHLAADRWQLHAEPLDADLTFLRRQGLDVDITTLTAFSAHRPQIGQILTLLPDPAHILYFDPQTHQRLR
jgi:multiple sugar transport system ATP-binding protein